MYRADAPNEIDEARIREALPHLATRDRLLIELGFETGLRLSELLSLRVRDVWRDGKPLEVLRTGRARLKGGRGARARSVSSRTIPLNTRAQAAIAAHLGDFEEKRVEPSDPLFSGQGRAQCPLTRQHAVRVIRKIFLGAGLSADRVWSGHSLRRRFVRRIHDATGDLNLVRQAVGHRWISTTQLYLGLEEERAATAILQLGHEPAPPGKAEDCDHFAQVNLGAG